MQTHPKQSNYIAMYSSWTGRITTDANEMTVPIDDHLVHRGDGVFEAFKAINGNIYLFNEHMTRLRESAKRLQLDIPWSDQEIKNKIKKLARATSEKDFLFRLFLSRGPGGFSPDPRESVGTQLYIVATKKSSPPERWRQSGVKLAFSEWPAKVGWLAQTKSCNYLQNVFMKIEAVEKNVDLVIGKDAEENVLEGATENLLIITHNNELIYPSLDTILRGTTMMRVVALAPTIDLKVISRKISLKDLYSAKEAILTGTTLDVVPVVTVEGRNIGGGQPGPIAKNLYNLICKDMKSSSQVLTSLSS